MYVLDTKIGEQHSIIKDVDYLHQKIFNILDDMSDFQLINFSREYKKELQLFFDYKTYIKHKFYLYLTNQTMLTPWKKSYDQPR